MEEKPNHNSYEMMKYLRDQRVAHLKAALADLYSEAGLAGAERLLLEIGCGHGHWLTAFAEAHPSTHCVGIDLRTHRIHRGQMKRDKRALSHLHFIKAEGREFLDSLPEGIRYDQVFLLFPDPWPKKRHHKKRLVQPGFLSQLAERVTPGGRLYYRTDHEGYFAWTVDHVRDHPDWEIEPKAEWPFEESSYFQEFMESWSSLIAVRGWSAADPGNGDRSSQSTGID